MGPPSSSSPMPPPDPNVWQLVWADEFDVDGAVNPSNWGFEHGFVRGKELQWYDNSISNAACEHGSLVITARREHPAEHPVANYTSASLTSQGKQQWTYGYFEMRGRIDIRAGAFPAWWGDGNFEDASGKQVNWPESGEIDMMEYFQGLVRTNFISTTKGRGMATTL